MDFALINYTLAKPLIALIIHHKALFLPILYVLFEKELLLVALKICGYCVLLMFLVNESAIAVIN